MEGIPQKLIYPRKPLLMCDITLILSQLETDNDSANNLLKPSICHQEYMCIWLILIIRWNSHFCFANLVHYSNSICCCLVILQMYMLSDILHACWQTHCSVSAIIGTFSVKFRVISDFCVESETLHSTQIM